MSERDVPVGPTAVERLAQAAVDVLAEQGIELPGPDVQRELGRRLGDFLRRVPSAPEGDAALAEVIPLPTAQPWTPKLVLLDALREADSLESVIVISRPEGEDEYVVAWNDQDLAEIALARDTLSAHIAGEITG